jgi:hypothetical protein
MGGCLQGIDGYGMADPSDTLRSLRPPLTIRLCFPLLPFFSSSPSHPPLHFLLCLREIHLLIKTHFLPSMTEAFVCPAGKWKCAYGGCVHNYDTCNGYDDCKDGSDETWDQTKESEAYLVSKRCDGSENCKDASDEQDCREFFEPLSLLFLPLSPEAYGMGHPRG